MTDSTSRFDQITNYDDEIPRHVAAYLNEVKTEKTSRFYIAFFRDEAVFEGSIWAAVLENTPTACSRAARAL